MHIDQNDKSVKILVIEDNPEERQRILEVLSRNFPFASIDVPASLFSGDVPSQIAKEKYNVVFLDSELYNWPEHKEYGQKGSNLIPLLKSTHPDAIIVAISSREDFNTDLMIKGAHIAIEKYYFRLSGVKIGSDLKVIMP